ncbi:prepilin-type N-terminal cleavage/methylation domain-containing protein [Pannus brasiliensis CCIBt3594]|uniref:Prepilin-type N-terminal cleavage/methylation domain-containing protein n=1 Tax=Pannus brasiliensis CCIBt3594 TaxID=1427578 RepID=A0AAW9QJH6_9CHRO
MVNPRWLVILAGNKPSDRGFTMLEVLIAIMVITFFLAGTLQLMAIDTLYKILAKQQANAAQWIQEDVEEIRALAAGITRNDALCKPTTITSTNNYASVLQGQIAASTTLPGANPRALLVSNGKLYQMARTYATVTTDQPNVLKISYTVTDIRANNTLTPDSTQRNQDINRDSTSVIARFYTEIIPAASFQCP